MSGKLFAQIVALIIIWGAVFFVATRVADWRRMVYAGAYMNATRSTTLAEPSPSVETDERLMGNAEVALNAMDDDRRLSGE